MWLEKGCGTRLRGRAAQLGGAGDDGADGAAAAAAAARRGGRHGGGQRASALDLGRRGKQGLRYSGPQTLRK